MKKIVLLVLFLMPLGANASSLPSGVFEVNDIVNYFRNIYLEKYRELDENFIKHTVDQKIRYISNKEQNCMWSMVPAKQNLGGIDYLKEQSGKQLTEIVQFLGCRDYPLVQEIYTTDRGVFKGYTSILKSRTNFELQEGENRRSLIIKSDGKTTFFKYLAERVSTTEVLYQFYFGDERFLSIHYAKKGHDITYTFYPYSLNLTIMGGARFNFNFEFETYSIKILKKGPFYQFFDYDSTQVSLNSLKKYFEHGLVKRTLSKLQRVSNMIVRGLPSTKVVSSGSVNQRLLEELRLIRSRLLTNTEIELVKRQIDKYIISAEAGDLVDRRPKEE